MSSGGTGYDLKKIRLQQKREKQQAALAKRKRTMENQTEAAVAKIGAENFAKTDEATAKSFTSATTGLLTVEQYKAKREELQLQAALEAKQAKKAVKTARKKRKRRMKTNLSFMGGDDDEDEEDEGDLGAKYEETLGKDPTVETTFLPDAKREEEEAKLRKQLALEWKEKQELVKQEKFNVVYSFWNGSGHRNQITMTKGDTVEDFLKAARPLHDDIRGMAIDRLMLVKEDCIIPQHFTFYELIVTKARGKTGPLFTFGVQDDILELRRDSTIPTDVSHPAKVMSRDWYDKNKHIYPANNWTVFDPSKQVQ